MKYFIEKVGVYPHGVAWIGDDLEEGEKKAKEFAQQDVDDYHEWVVYEFASEQDYCRDMSHVEKYSCRKEMGESKVYK